MAVSQLDIQYLIDIFKGNDKAYGVTVLGDTVNGKVQASCRLQPGKIDNNVMARHLSGQQSIGVAPIMADGTCWFGAIDIDEYQHSWGIQRIVERLYEFKLPLIPCYSKSKHLHLYLFLSLPAPARALRELLREYVALVGASDRTELFPKQDTVNQTAKFYSWINLPYFNESGDDCRKMVNNDGSLASCPSFIESVREKRQTLEAHTKFIHSMDYNDAPMCVRAFHFLGDCETGRNNNMFNVGVYFKTKYPEEDLTTYLERFNESLINPLEIEELHNTIISGFEKNTYTYNCKGNEFCCKAYCNKTPFNPTKTLGLSFGQLIQYNTEPVTYDWYVKKNDGEEVVLHFPSADSLLNQERFRTLVMTLCHVVPYKVKSAQWADTLNLAMRNLVVKDSTNTDEFTTGSLITQMIYNYFTGSLKTNNIADIYAGRVYDDTINNVYMFSPQSILQYVINTYAGKGTPSPEDIRTTIMKIGGYQREGKWYISKDKIPQKEKKDDGF